MFVSRIYLKNFRNFESFDHKFSNGCNIIVASNGTGKTNLLESIQTLSLGKSLRATTQIDLIRHGCHSAFIKGEIENNILDFNIKKLDIGQRVTKTLKRNNKNVSNTTFSDLFVSLWFSAESMNVINASSSAKRDFLDNFIGSINKIYFSLLRRYKQALHQKHLLLIKSDIINTKNYDYLNELLIKYGSQLIEIRNHYIKHLRNKLHENILERYFYKFNFYPSIEVDEIFEENIAVKMREKLSSYKDRELAARRCLVGPHKDTWDLSFCVSKKEKMHDLGIFGSRGQKRIGVLNILISFLRIVDDETGKKPVLLLDDITSELDTENISIVERILFQEDTQTFMTSTTAEIHNKDFLKKSEVIKLETT